MKKLYALLMTIALLFVITGCKKNNKPKRPIEIDSTINYFGANKTVSDVTITNVPKQIELGYFATSKIKLNIFYVDGSKEEQTLTEKFFPKSYLEELKTTGDKYFDFIYRGKHIPLKFKQVAAKTPMTYRVAFYNEKGEVVDRQYINYLEKANIDSSKLSKISDYSKDGFYYKFSKTFDQDIEYIYSDLDCKPVYKVFKMYGVNTGYYDYNSYPPMYDVIDSKIDEHYYRHTLLYVGRLSNFALANLTNPYTKNDYEAKSWRFQKRETINDFYQHMNDNLKDYLAKSYYHETATPCESYITVKNTNRFDINLKNTKNYELGNDTTGKFNVKLQDFFVGDLTKTNYDLDRTSQRRDGGLFGYSSVFDQDMNIYTSEDYYYGNKTFEIGEIASDYALGNYNMDFVCDIDIYIDVEYEFYHDSSKCMFTFHEVNFAFCYVTGSGKFVMNHTSEPTYEYYGSTLEISNYMIANSLYDAETH